MYDAALFLSKFSHHTRMTTPITSDFKTFEKGGPFEPPFVMTRKTKNELRD